MKINIYVKPNKKREYVEQNDLYQYTVSVRAPARDGKANQAVLELLAKHFEVTPNKIILISGQTSQYKVFEVPDQTKSDS